MSARFTLFSAATAVVLAPLLYDAALKGVLLLAAAGLVVLGLRRASAAARHLVWLVAMVALVVVPVLTVALPRWRVLPAWTAWPKPPAHAPHRHPVADPGPRVETGATAPPMRESPTMTSTSDPAPIVVLPERTRTAPSLPARSPVRSPAPPASAATWAVAAWTAGFLILSVRLLAAHCLLRRARRRAKPCPSGPLAEALSEAAVQLGVRSPVSLRLDARRTIPLVWGVLRPCLLLPAEARDWSREQLRSVLLHELAHLKRRDPLVQALAQVALALHWFNPLAWLAAWRLHVERERACDDLVLASGVRSSEYATHLLRVATDLTPAPWTSACGLAMARRSSLEARLRAVLNDRCNRRSMTRALTAAALLLSLVIAIPVAMLRAADDTWNPPNAAHIVTNSFSAYCVHGLKDVAFVLAYPGQTSSSSAHDSNSQTRTWTDTGTFTAIQPDIAIGFFRQHTAPDTLVLTTTPASARYLSKPAPPPRPFGQTTFDLTQGRVFLLSDNATIRQLDLPAPLVTDTASAEKLAALIAALPPPAPETQSAKPTHESAQSLFQKWQSRARTNGQVPGALIRQLSRQVTEFIKQNPDTDEAKKLATLRPRFEAAAARDWGPAEAAGLLDAVAAITTAPLDWSSLPMEFDAFSLIKTGEPLPAELASAAWGPPAENGLRAAWLLEPRAEAYPLGTVLKVRVLFHNAGTEPVVFRTETWHQSDSLTVRDAQGADVKTTRTWYTGITPLANYRLRPGEYCEVSAPGVAIGAGTYEDERSTGSLGLIIEAKEGDVLSLSCLVDAAQGIAFSRPGDPNDPRELWKKQVADRIASEAPLPSSPADREHLIRRVLLDLTGEPPTVEEIAQFVADPAPDALDTLTARLQAKEPTLPWTGKLTTGTTQFRVLAADPEAAKAPRSANGPGRYVLGDSAHLLVRQITEGGKRTNAAEIVFSGPDPKKESPHPPLRIELADGLASYGIVWERGAGTLWVMDKERLRRVDFANPAATREVNIRPGNLKNLPEPLQDTMRQAFNAAGASGPQLNPPQPAGGTKLDPATEAQLDWGEPVNGLRGALLIRSPGAGQPEGIYLVVQNVAETPVRFVDTIKSEKLRKFYVSDTKGILFVLSNGEPTQTDVVLQPREVAHLSMLLAESSDGERLHTDVMIEGLRKDSLQTWRAVLEIAHTQKGAWTGKLTTSETRGAVREGGPQPTNDRAQALFKHWQNSARLNGDIPGGLVALLHEKVLEFIRNNEPDASGGPYAQKMKPLEPRFAHTGDWNRADVVTLLDDIAAAHTIPLETTLEHLTERTLQPGTPLPASLQNADWGEPLPSGLRMAHVLEPRAGGYPLGTELKARLVLHNSGPEPVAFLTTTFQQPGHAAQRADGTDLTIDSTEWLTLGRLAAYRLAPGESCELHTPGLGIGARDNDRDDWANVRAGSWILCAEGDEVVFTPGAAALSYRDMAEPPADWWLAFITERLNRETPVPTDTKEREYLLYRVVRELYGTAPSTTEGDAFAADTSPDALKNLAALLAKHPYGTRSDGVIRAGTTKFRVLPPDTDAGQRPRVATGPGWYSLSDSVKFSVTRRATGNRVRNEAALIYFQQGQENVSHKVTLPDGHDSLAAATLKGAAVLWIAEPGALRKLDFANPLQPVETRYEAGKLGDALISKELRAALDAVLSNPAPDAPKLKQPTPPAAEAPGAPPSEKSDASQWDIRQHDGRDYVTLESFAKFYRLLRTERVADGFKLSSSQMAIAGTLGRPVVTINGISFALDHPIVEVANALLVSRADIGLLFDPVLRPHAQNATFNGTVILDPTGDGLNLAMVWAREVQNKLSAAGFTVLLTRGAEARGDAEASLRLAAAHPGAVVLGLDFKEESGAEIHGPETRVMSTAVPESLRKVSRMLATAVHGHMRMKLAAEDRGIRSGDVPLLTQSTIPAIVLEAGCLSNDRNSNQWNDPAFRGRAAEAVTAGMKAFQRSVKVPSARTGAEGSLEKRGTRSLSPEALLGTWRGMVNNERLMLSFHRPPAETEVQLDIYFGDATIGTLATFTLADDGGSAVVVQASAGGGMKFGTLVPSEAGQLKLELYGRQKGQQEVMLTRDADAVATEPRQTEARAEVKPERTHLWNDTYAAVGFQTEKDVHFVLVTEGFISTGLSESWSDTSKRWTIEGNIHLVDPEKTKAAGQNVDKRVISLKHTSDEPTKLYLDGKAYELSAATTATPTGAVSPPGRLFILREEGEPIQTARTLPLRNQQDLATIGGFAADVRATFQN